MMSLRDRPIDVRVLKRMCDRMKHRGPDDAGYVFFRIGHSGPSKSTWREYFEKDFTSHHPDYFSEMPVSPEPRIEERKPWDLALGHRRLSILDLTSAGHQPMTDSEKKIWITYNGEVYNFQELREELVRLGFSFRSSSDTEVIINSYRAWGIECIFKFNGMFAFALWDNERKRLYLVRDRYGIKPLYYCLKNGTLLFASEIKAILEHEEVAREVDPEALYEYFTFQNILSDRTLFRGVYLLSAGHVLSVQQDPGLTIKDWQRRPISSQTPWKVDEWRYWDFDFSETVAPEDISEEECVSELRRLFSKAVERNLVSDVTVGTYLSGGIDSGAIAATASRRIPRLMSFTGGFDLSSVNGLEATFDERESAEFMASCFGTEHYEMVMHSGDMAWVMPTLIWHLEDLRVGMCWQNYYIARLAGKFVKVVLSGTGGDENFAGYPWRYHLAFDRDRGENRKTEAYYRYWQRLVEDERKPRFFDPRILKNVDEGYCRGIFKRILDRGAGTGSGDFDLATCLYFELKTFLHGLFVVEDKLSMAHSLETRVPFLDNDLVSFASRIPSEYKLPRGDGMFKVEENVVGAKTKFFAQSNSGKYIFRQAMRGIVPDEILDRKKQGFSPPDQSWYRGPTMGYVRDILLNERALSRGFFNSEYIRGVVDEHTTGKVNHRLLLWSLLSFEWWNRTFLDG
jgi:asparagine synthase (glutamine-hydrolysing)